MNEEKTKQLRRYIETLIALKREGFSCNKEIQEALKELHSEMGFDIDKSNIQHDLISGDIKIGGITISNAKTSMK